MAISGDYPQPVHVNGFTCKNCTDVDYAKKHIDPAHPKSGPYDVNAATDPSRKTQAIVFGGTLEGLNRAAPATAGQSGQSASSYTAGTQLDTQA